MSENWTTLRQQIEYFSKPFPRSAIAFANQHRDEVAPYLIDALAAVAANPLLADDDEYVLHLYAMHLLAAWRDTRAYSAMVAIGRHPSDILDIVLGEVVAESYARCLASVCDGNIKPLYSLFEDTQASYWARKAALDALKVRVIEGDYSRDDLIQYLKVNGESEVTRLRAPDLVFDDLGTLDCIVSVATDICAVEMSAQIEGWFDDALIDTLFLDKKWVFIRIALPFEIIRDLELARGNGYVVDVETEISWWAGFVEDPPLNTSQALTLSGKKIGRNEPCPCGSAKKYKKCCGAN